MYVCVLRRLQLKYVSLRLSAPVQKMLTDKANTAISHSQRQSQSQSHGHCQGQDALLHGLSIRQISWGPYLRGLTYFLST